MKTKAGKHVRIMYRRNGKLITRRAKVLAIDGDQVLVTWDHRQHMGWVFSSQIA